MNINKAMLTLALGFVLAVSTSAQSQDMISQTATTTMLFQAATQDTSQPMTREQAKALAQRNARVSLPPKQGQSQYVQEALTVGQGSFRVIVLEDWKHKNVCYLTLHLGGAHRPSTSCVPMH